MPHTHEAWVSRIPLPLAGHRQAGWGGAYEPCKAAKDRKRLSTIHGGEVDAQENGGHLCTHRAHNRKQLWVVKIRIDLAEVGDLVRT
jgi:hypothetical protein